MWCCVGKQNRQLRLSWRRLGVVFRADNGICKLPSEIMAGHATSRTGNKANFLPVLLYLDLLLSTGFSSRIF